MIQRFIVELQRRKVLRAASAYAIGAWIVLQVAVNLQTAMSLSPSFSGIILTVLVIGFPVAVSLAWFFEITPDGIRRTQPAASDEAPAKLQTTDFILAAAVLLVLIVGAVQLLWPAQPTPAVETAEAPRKTEVKPLALAQNAIAVLPFANRSPEALSKQDPGSGDFLAELISSHLGKATALDVKSQTSASAFKGKEIALPEIARQLRARLIIEGSVRSEGGKVVVGAQLIDADADKQLWQEIYERRADNTLYMREIAAAIATSVAQELNATLDIDEQRAFIPTQNSEALKAFEEGRKLYRMSGEENLRRALKALDQAVELDPDFAIAWALLSRVNSYLYFNRTDATKVRRLSAKQALDKALRLEPRLADVLLAEAYYIYWVERDLPNAQAAFEELSRKWPSNADVVAALASIARREGRWSESKAYFEKALALDPLHISRSFAAAELSFATRDFLGALTTLQESMEHWKSPPDNMLFVAKKALVHLALGELDKAEALLADVRPRPGDDVVEPIVYAAILRRKPKAAIELLERLFQRDQADGSVGRTSLDLNIYLGNLRRVSGDVAGAKANYLAALDELEAEAKKQEKSADIYSYLALVYCGLGNKKQALNYAARAVATTPVSKDAWAGAYYEDVQARVRARFGDREFAIPAIKRLLRLPAPLPLTPALLRLDPDFDKIRADARFISLLNTND